MKVLVSSLMMLSDQKRFSNLLHENGLEAIFADVEQFMSKNQCLKYAGKVDGWIAGDDQINEEVINAFLPRLKVISKWGTGLDSIDLAEANRKSLPVLNSPGAFSDAVSEVALGYMLDLSRKITLTDRMVRNGGWPKFCSTGLVGKTVGIVGMGAIGQGVVKRLKGCGTENVFYDPAEDISVDNCSKVTLERLYEISDFICLTCNLNKENHHMINMNSMRLMKPAVMLINVARGGLIDSKALLYCLENRIIAGAALDVYEDEPLVDGFPFKEFDNVILGSHNANNQKIAVEFVHENTLQNLFSVLLPSGC